MRTKIVVIGLDGATWDVILPFVSKGQLPTFEKLLKNGSWGILKSTLPPVTVPAWPAFATGKNPAKFGVYNFLIIDKNTGHTRIVNSYDIKSKKIWDYLSIYGKKVIIINHPVTYPPERVNGIMISGMLTPPSAKNYAYPIEIVNKLNKLDYIIEPDSEIVVKKWDQDIFIKELLKTAQKRFDITMYFLENYDWDFFFVLFRVTDIIQHKQYQNKELVLKIYKTIDEYLSKIIENVDENTHLILMSDHGFCEFRKQFNITKWLYDLGYIKIKKKVNSNKSFLTGVGITQMNVLKILRLLHLDWIRKYIPIKFKTKLPVTSKEIDIKESKAYPGILFTGTSQYISLNNEKITNESQYTKLVDELISKMYSIKDPVTGEGIIEVAYRKEDIYKGPFLRDAPDIIFLLKKGYGISTFLDLSAPIIEEVPYPFGYHYIDGIFLIYGPGIKRNNKVGEASIIDIAPTILHMFGMPIPDDMDGKVIMEIFEEDSEYINRKCRYVDSKYYEKLKIKGTIKKMKQRKNL